MEYTLWVLKNTHFFGHVSSYKLNDSKKLLPTVMEFLRLYVTENGIFEKLF